MDCEYPGCTKEAVVVQYDPGCPYCHGGYAGCSEPFWYYYCDFHSHGASVPVDTDMVLSASEVAAYQDYLAWQTLHPTDYYVNLIIENWPGYKTLEEVQADGCDTDLETT